MGSAQTPIEIVCLPHFAIYREYLTGYLGYTLASCSNVSHFTNVGGQAREQLSFVVLDLPNPHFRSDTKYVQEIDLPKRPARAWHGRKLVCPKPYSCSPGTGRSQLGCRWSSPGRNSAVDPQRAVRTGGRRFNRPERNCRQSWRRPQRYFRSELYPVIHCERRNVPLHHGWQRSVPGPYHHDSNQDRLCVPEA